MPPFTPGPWGVEQTSDTNWIGPLRTDGKVYDVVCQTDREGLRMEPRARNDANAVLIAASPELFQLLTAAMHALKSYQYGIASPILAMEITDAADALLTKIDGRRP